MSILKVDTLKTTDSTNSIAMERVANGTAAAWVNFDGSGTVAIRASYNVSSITDNGTGDYTVNFTNAMPDVNYTPVISISPPYSVSRNCSVELASSGNAIEVAPTVSQFRFGTGNGNVAAGSAFDPKYIAASFFR